MWFYPVTGRDRAGSEVDLGSPGYNEAAGEARAESKGATLGFALESRLIRTGVISCNIFLSGIFGCYLHLLFPLCCHKLPVQHGVDLLSPPSPSLVALRIYSASCPPGNTHSFFVCLFSYYNASHHCSSVSL